MSYSYRVESISFWQFSRMQFAWKDKNPIPLADLRSIRVTHWDFHDRIAIGHLIMHKSVADEIVEIFRELFDAKFPIEKMQLIDEYEANDELSMEDNNSSAFCSRPITGTTDQWSLHSYGVAIDINPLVNPYVRGDFVTPPGGRNYLDRSVVYKGGITADSICCQIFKRYGWNWGGDWKDRVDYQHFEKPSVIRQQG